MGVTRTAQLSPYRWTATGMPHLFTVALRIGVEADNQGWLENLLRSLLKDLPSGVVIVQDAPGAPNESAAREATGGQPLDDAIERWALESGRLGSKSKSIKKRALRIRSLFRELGWRSTRDGDKLQLVEHLTAMRTAGISVKTIETLLSQVSTLFDFCVEQGWCSVNPAFGIKRSKKARGHGQSKRRGVRAFTDAESRSVIAAAQADEAAPERRCGFSRSHLYRVARWTGARIGQLCCAIRWRDVDLDDAQPHAVFDGDEAKNDASWRVPLHREALKALREWRAMCVVASPDDFVFPQMIRERVLWADMKAGGVARRGGPSMRSASWHSFRKLFCTDLVVAGVAPGVAQRLMQHRCIEMTMRVYAEVRDEQLAAGVACVEDFFTARNPLETPGLGDSWGCSQPPSVGNPLDGAGGSTDAEGLTSADRFTMNATNPKPENVTSPALGSAAIGGGPATGETFALPKAGLAGSPASGTARLPSEAAISSIGVAGFEPPAKGSRGGSAAAAVLRAQSVWMAALADLIEGGGGA